MECFLISLHTSGNIFVKFKAGLSDIDYKLDVVAAT